MRQQEREVGREDTCLKEMNTNNTFWRHLASRSRKVEKSSCVQHGSTNTYSLHTLSLIPCSFPTMKTFLEKSHHDGMKITIKQSLLRHWSNLRNLHAEAFYKKPTSIRSNFFLIILRRRLGILIRRQLLILDERTPNHGTHANRGDTDEYPPERKCIAIDRSIP